MKCLLVLIATIALLSTLTLYSTPILVSSSPSRVPSMKPVLNCTTGAHLSQYPPGTLTPSQGAALATPGLYPSYPLGVPRPPSALLRRPNCVIAHYTLYSPTQQAQVIQACFAHAVYQVALPPFASCELLYQADPTKDRILPEFAGMRAAFTRLLRQFEASKGKGHSSIVGKQTTASPTRQRKFVPRVG